MSLTAEVNGVELTRFTTNELIDFIRRQDGYSVEVKIINGQFCTTHFIY